MLIALFYACLRKPTPTSQTQAAKYPPVDQPICQSVSQSINQLINRTHLQHQLAVMYGGRLHTGAMRRHRLAVRYVCSQLTCLCWTMLITRMN